LGPAGAAALLRRGGRGAEPIEGYRFQSGGSPGIANEGASLPSHLAASFAEDSSKSLSYSSAPVERHHVAEDEQGNTLRLPALTALQLSLPNSHCFLSWTRCCASQTLAHIGPKCAVLNQYLECRGTLVSHEQSVRRFRRGKRGDPYERLPFKSRRFTARRGACLHP
jgi:hypothetical protein